MPTEQILYTTKGIKNLQAAAPPLIIDTAVTRGGPRLKHVNPKAIAFLKLHHDVANVLQNALDKIWPGGVAKLRQIAPPLTVHSQVDAGMGNKFDKTDMNPAAKAFVASTGLPFDVIYPKAPDWSSHNLGTKEVAQEYSKLSGKDFNTFYHNWYHASDWDNFVNGIGSAVKTALPIVETALSFVPGVGTVASMAVSAVGALAEGEPIDEAMADIGGAAIPGGKVASAAYKAGKAIATGHGDAGSLVGQALAAGVGAAGIEIPPQATQAISAGVGATVDIAQGKKPDQALLRAALSQLPEAGRAVTQAASGLQMADALLQYGPKMIPGLSQEAQSHISRALGAGVAVGQAQLVQAGVRSQIKSSLNQLASVGQKTVAADPFLTAGANLAGNALGYHVGVGLAQHPATRFQVAATRQLLDKADRHAYDTAIALHVGRSSVPTGMSHEKAAGYAAAVGSRGFPAAARLPVLKIAGSSEKSASGIAQAMQENVGGVKLWQLLGVMAGGFAGSFFGLTWALLGAAGSAAGEIWFAQRSFSHGKAA